MSLDADILLWINGHHTEWLDTIMWWTSHPATWLPLYIVLMILVAVRFRSWKAADASEQVFRAAIAGREVDCQELFDAIGCADRDFFSNFFGLSYADQATGERKLRAENLSRVIYGLSVGDADRFERARKILNDRREKLFKATGSTPRLNVALDKFVDAKNTAAVSNETREYREAENDKKHKESTPRI